MNDYQKIAKIIHYIATHSYEQPSLKLLAEMAGWSSYHFQRKFTAWVGVSPKSYLQCMTLKNARTLLDQGNTILDVALDSGLSGPGRLHDLCVTLDAATPAEIRNGGAGLKMSYGFGISPFGICLLASSTRGVCYLAFIDDDEHAPSIKALEQEWPGADLVNDNCIAQDMITRIFSPQRASHPAPLRTFVKGTNFQLQVWRALLKIPEGKLVTYGTLATAIGRPGAARAVGTAVGANSLAYIIPCHRVIRTTGLIGDYRWGSGRKKSLIACEHARSITP